ncbi:MAG: DUF3421 domain-containing protein [Gammaproteobacteria bacterium]|nr:DUF3421 domain-containing protein [Gammaproteobacteria bacterium]
MHHINKLALAIFSLFALNTSFADNGYSSSQAQDSTAVGYYSRGSSNQSATVNGQQQTFSAMNSNYAPPHVTQRHPVYIKWATLPTHSPIPPQAVVGGEEANYPYYICRALYRNVFHPGKLVGAQCNITYGGNEISVTPFQVLLSRNTLHWVDASHGYIPPRTLFAGVENGQRLYICQGVREFGMYPGKVINQRCYIGWNGKEFALTQFNVLVK